MSKSYHMNLRVDGELHAALDDYAKRHRLTLSQAVRDLLRHGLGVSSGPDAGWREGYNAAVTRGRKAFTQALQELSSTLPEDWDSDGDD